MKLNNIIKKIFLFTFILISILFINVNVKADSDEIEYDNDNKITVTGGSIRTTGSEGLRFECNSTYKVYGNNTIEKYGALIAFGKISTASEIVNAKNSTINGHSILDGYVTETDKDGVYYVTIQNIPSSYYLQNITIVPYIYILNDSTKTTKTIYSSIAVTRNLTEVGLKAINDGYTSTLLEDVKTNASNYKKSFTDDCGYYHLDTALYETNPKNLYYEFAKDWNKLVKNGTFASNLELYGYATTNESIFSDIAIISENDSISADYTTTAFYKFFDIYSDKWGWLLDVFEIMNTRSQSYLTNQIKLLNKTGGSIYYYGNRWKETVFALAGYFTQTDVSSLVANYTYTEGENKYTDNVNFASSNCSGYYSLTTQYNKTIYANLTNVETYKVGSTITMPDTPSTTTSTQYNWKNITTDDIQYYPNLETNVSSRDLLLLENKVSSSTLVVSEGTTIETLKIGNSGAKIKIESNSLDSIEVIINNNLQNVTISGNENITQVNNFNILKKDVSDYKGLTLNNITIENFNFTNDLATFFDIIESDGCYSKNIKFYNCIFNANSSDNNGIICITNNHDVTFENCTFNNSNGNAINILKSDNGCGETGSIKVTNCSFNEINGCCLYVEYFNPTEDYEQIIFEGNTICNKIDYNQVAVCVSESTSNKINILNNNITNCTKACMQNGQEYYHEGELIVFNNSNYLQDFIHLTSPDATSQTINLNAGIQGTSAYIYLSNLNIIGESNIGTTLTGNIILSYDVNNITFDNIVFDDANITSLASTNANLCASELCFKECTINCNSRKFMTLEGSNGLYFTNCEFNSEFKNGECLIYIDKTVAGCGAIGNVFFKQCEATLGYATLLSVSYWDPVDLKIQIRIDDFILNFNGEDRFYATIVEILDNTDRFTRNEQNVTFQINNLTAQAYRAFFCFNGEYYENGILRAPMPS